MSTIYKNILLEQICVDEPLPCTLYVKIDSRQLTFRAAGDIINKNTYDRLQFKKVTSLYILEKDLPLFREWSKKQPQPAQTLAADPEAQAFASAWKDAHRKTLDIFQSNQPEEEIKLVIKASKLLVSEVMKYPFAVKSLDQIQIFSRGTVDHSVNVSVLSVYLAMQMGYSHNLILQHVALGGLLHDIGKTKVEIQDSDTDKTIEAKMRAHPTLGAQILETMESVPDEVKLIVGQHHEFHDGSGYPKKLRGSNIYDLARIVCIANLFDHLVGDGKGTLQERQRRAVTDLDRKFMDKLDHDKHEKAVRILGLGV